jgi:glycerophosphoryl diester phosphodiesterase
VSRPRVLGHRGARRAAPENTIAAFAAARTQGADGVELDVRRTRDGALVVHHNPAPAGGPVLATMTSDEVRRGFPSIPTLDEALDECRGLLVNIEIKNLPWESDFDEHERPAESVIERLRARGGADRVLVSSFHLATIDRVRALDETVATGFLFLAGVDPQAMIDLAAERGHEAAHPDARALVDPDTAAAAVHRARTRGLAVNVWTVNDPADVVRFARLGVDALVTDVPDVVLATLDQETGNTTESASGS